MNVGGILRKQLFKFGTPKNPARADAQSRKGTKYFFSPPHTNQRRYQTAAAGTTQQSINGMARRLLPLVVVGSGSWSCVGGLRRLRQSERAAA